jgi:hypothetical protein
MKFKNKLSFIIAVTTTSIVVFNESTDVLAKLGSGQDTLLWLSGFGLSIVLAIGYLFLTWDEK